MLLNIASLVYIPAAMGIAAMSRITLYNFAGKPESGGLMSIVRMMNSSDVAGPISVLLKILAGMSEKK